MNLLSSNKTRYVYLNGNVIEELDSSNNLVARNILGNELIYRKNTIDVRDAFYYYNGHGDVVRIRDNNGSLVNLYDYDTWGNVITQSGTFVNPFKYTGEVQDDESGLIYLRARYYDPLIGRFITEDTYEGELSNPLSQNLYTYVHNNPLRYIDPSGNVAVDSKVWDLNKQINDLKIQWALQNAAGNIKARDLAASNAQKLREDFLKLNPSSKEGLLGKNDSVLDYRPYEGKNRKFMEIAVGSNGTVYYEADFKKYDYYEQVHVQSKAEHGMGSLAKAAVGYYIGKVAVPSKPVINNSAGILGVWGMDSYLPGLPDVGEVKTMAYRTNKETGAIEHMVIDTNSYNVLKWKHSWKPNK